MQYKNIPKIKVLRIPCQFNMIFSGIFKNLLCKNHRGGSCHLDTRVEGAPYPPGRAPCLVGPWWLPSTYSCTHTLLLPPKKIHQPAQAWVLSHLAAIFDLLAQSSIHKTALGDCSLVCDSSNGPISFCSSALFIANFCCLGDPVLELACQIIWSKVVLMHDIGSRHL